MRAFRLGFAFSSVLMLGGCGAALSTLVTPKTIKAESSVSCDNRTGNGPVSSETCELVNQRIQQEADLVNARVGFDVAGKGRLQLTGKYLNEDQVVRVFAIAQAMVGSDWVSPVNPGQVMVEAWQQCLQAKLAGRGCEPNDDVPYSLDNKPPGPVRDRYGLVVGVGQFQHGIRPLKYAANDARAVADYLRNPKFGNFSESHLKLLIDQQATSQAIESALIDIEAQAQQDDLVVVYLSSHGAPPNVYGQVNIVSYDTEVLFSDRKQEQMSTREKALQRQSLWDSSIPRKRLHQFFVNLAAKGVKRTLMVLDVCYSGDALKEFPGFRPEASELLARHEESYATGYSADQLMQILGAKDLALTGGGAGHVGAVQVMPQKLVPMPLPASKRYGDDWGQVIISASGEGEQSWEPDPRADSQTPNSYFTHYFLENLKRSSGKVQESFDSAVPSVIQKVMQIANKSQRPQSFALPNKDKWNFSLSGRR